MKNISIDHLINNRNLTTFKSIEEELRIQPQTNYLFDLSCLDVLDVEGDKALDFLQGQLTCDTGSVSDIQMIQGAQCNLKGRILNLMDVLCWRGIKLVLYKDLMDATIRSLSKTALLSKVSLNDKKHVRVFGFYLQNRNDIVPDTLFFPDGLYALTQTANACYYHLGQGFYGVLVESECAHDMEKRFYEKEQLLGSLTWHTMRLMQKDIAIYPESRGLFLPHRIDLQQTPFLSFNKGCYKGQEIIARMHYKAALKHHLKLYEIKSEQRIYSGQKIVHPVDGSELGEVIDYSILGQGRYLTAVSIMKNSGPTTLLDGHNDAIDWIAL